ncbi:glycosyltransferase [Mangrovibacterium marinum]|uniref:glycosyltransferase n=1 Tax=Mangrovibacterium marinum TaxID=1639118 RepID=UPI002A1872F1|nr:glycosyltransferase [Mangrovibacterium marinum]
MKIALVHDELIRRGGAEQVTLLMHKAFPGAPIYTTCYNSATTYSEFKDCDIRTSWLNRFIKDEKNLKRFFFPFSFWSMRSLNLNEFDVVFMSTTTYGKFIKPNKNALVVSFTHYPFRLAWFPESYNQVKESSGLKKTLFGLLVKTLREMDYKAAQRIDFHITNTPKIKTILENCYQTTNAVSVIPASIVCDNFIVKEFPSEDFYLLVSRFEPYKKVDLVIEAFNELPDKRLIVVGKGSQKDYCRKIAGPNVEFKEGISTEELKELYANCKAFLFPQEEDYGLTPIEANASGRPVIAYGKGGVTYTTIPYDGDSKRCTAIYFDEQNKEKLIQAIQLCEQLEFNPHFIRKHAEQFDEKVFIEKIRNFVFEKYKEHVDKTTKHS